MSALGDGLGGGLSLLWGVVQGGCGPGGLSGPWGMSAPCGGVSAPRGVPACTEADPLPPVNRMNDRQV